jgi:nicotinamidase-related amidase
MSLTPPLRLTAETSAVLVIDVQEKLLPAVPTARELLLNLGFLLDVARLLGVPVLATEQYPRGLGGTAPELLARLPAERPAKTAFSCAAVPSVLDSLQNGGRRQLVATGLETHVCVLQTVLDFLSVGVTVFVPVDAVAGRFSRDHELAVRRLERAGAILTTCETTAFEWLGDAAAPHFKEVSKLVQERAKALREGPAELGDRHD